MFDVLYYFALVTGLFPIAVYLCTRQRGKGLQDAIEPFLWLIIIATIYEFVGTTIFQISTAWWFRLYSLLEFGTLLYFFQQIIKRHPAFFICSGIVFFSVFIFLLFSGKAIDSLTGDGFLSALETLFVYTCSLIWFRRIFIDMAERSLWDLPNFYFVSGFILYVSGTLFLFLTANLIFKSETGNFKDYWMLNIIFNILLRVLLILGIWKGYQKSTQYSGQVRP